jgi:hypothetical protein
MDNTKRTPLTRERVEELRSIISRGEDFRDGSSLYLSKQSKADLLRILGVAPDLLGALINILPVFDNDGTRVYAKVYAKEIAQAEAAIAKAKGE